MKPTLMIAALLAGSCLLNAPAQAGDYYGGFYPNLPYHGYGYSGSLYGLGFIPVPPYYAIHPPVYYSHPVARPYGASPYARYPERYEPRREPARCIVNPFVPQQSQTDDPVEPAEKVAAVQVIHNPFYHQTQTELASTE